MHTRENNIPVQLTVQFDSALDVVATRPGAANRTLFYLYPIPAEAREMIPRGNVGLRL